MLSFFQYFPRIFVMVWMRLLQFVFLASLLVIIHPHLQAEIVYPDPPENITLHGRVASATSLTPPFFSGGYLVFPYRGFQKPRRFVGIAFDYEDYKNIYSFVKNKKGIYVFYGRIPHDIKEFSYRLVVDSVWQHDSGNPIVYVNRMGVKISRFRVDDKVIKNNQYHSPQSLPDGRTTFYFWGKPGMYAFIMGSFNQWDPFMTLMEEVTPGHYEISLHLRPGRYYYNFFVDGSRLRDPNNFFQALGPGGEMVSVIDIKF